MAASTVSKDSEGIYTDLASPYQDVYSTLGQTSLNSPGAQHKDLKVPKYASTEYSEMERELEELRANYSRAIQVERKKNNTASFAMLEKKYKYLDQYCPSNSKETVCRPCPLGWEQFSSKCYCFSTEVKMWHDSHSDCRDHGAGLVIIESKGEQEFITKHTREHPYWIGLSDFTNEGTWLWADKTLLQKGYWRSGEPDDHYWTENKTQGKIKEADCVVTVPDENTWEDTRCFSERGGKSNRHITVDKYTFRGEY